MAAAIKVTMESVWELSWPHSCVCCGDSSAKHWYKLGSASKGTRASSNSRNVTVVERTWNVPCCSYCARHWTEAAGRRGNAYAIYFLAGLCTIPCLIAYRDSHSKWYLIFCGLIWLAGILFHSIGATRKLKTQPKTNCAAAIPAKYKFTDKSSPSDPSPKGIQCFLFRNRAYAEAFLAANRSKCKMTAEEIY